VVVSQYDVIKSLLHKPILSGRMGKWAYALIEYDLTFEPLRATKSQVVADFVVDHTTGICVENGMVEVYPWQLVFDGSVCGRGNGIGCVIVSLNKGAFRLSIRLDFMCTNNQVEYEALIWSLEYLLDMGVKDKEAFRDSKLIVQQIEGESQCVDGVLNAY
jgi:hypothetical protein